MNIRNATSLLMIGAILAGAAACGGTGKSRTTFAGLGAAQLVSAFDVDRSNRDIPLYHVLFVPDIDPPRGVAFGLTGSGGGTSKNVQIGYGYDQYADGQSTPALSIQAQPVHILNRTTLEAGGRSFDLAQGNVFVASVSRDGALQVTQLAAVPDSYGTSPESILGYIKTSMPDRPRVQAVKPST